MKTTKKKILFVWLLVSVVSLAVCTRLEFGAPRPEELEAAIARSKWRLQRHLADTEEHQRRHQVLLEAMNNDKNRKMDLGVLETLNRIARTSVRDTRAFAEELRRRRDSRLRKALKAMEREKEEKALLERRWWRATVQLQQCKTEQEAKDLANLRQAQNMAAKIKDTLEEADRLRTLRQEIDLATEKVLAHRKAGRQEGIFSGGWRLLSSLWSGSPEPEAVPVTHAPDSDTDPDIDSEIKSPTLEKEQGKDFGLDTEAPSVEKEPEEDFDSDSEAPSVEKEPEEDSGSDSDTEAPSVEKEPEEDSGSDTEAPSVEKKPEEDSGSDTEAPSVEKEPEEDSGSDTEAPSVEKEPEEDSGSDTESPSVENEPGEDSGSDAEAPSVEDQPVAGGDASPLVLRCDPKKPFMWLVLLHAAMVLTVATVRIYNRDWSVCLH